MSGDALSVTTAHLVGLSAGQVRAAADIRSATSAVEGADAAVRSTHGVISSATADAVSQIVAARREAGTKMAMIADELGDKLTEAARRYEQTDDTMGRALRGQVQPR
jgi:hypothetical protein